MMKEIALLVTERNVKVFEIDEVKKTLIKIDTVKSSAELAQYAKYKIYAKLNTGANMDLLNGLNVEILTADEMQTMLVDKVF